MWRYATGWRVHWSSALGKKKKSTWNTSKLSKMLLMSSGHTLKILGLHRKSIFFSQNARSLNIYIICQFNVQRLQVYPGREKRGAMQKQSFILHVFLCFRNEKKKCTTRMSQIKYRKSHGTCRTFFHKSKQKDVTSKTSNKLVSLERIPPIYTSNNKSINSKDSYWKTLLGGWGWAPGTKHHHQPGSFSRYIQWQTKFTLVKIELQGGEEI